VARALIQARVARERARLRVLEPVLELAQRVRQGAGLDTVCQTIIDLASGQPGTRGAAILLEEPDQGSAYVAATRGMLVGISSLETASTMVSCCWRWTGRPTALTITMPRH
jgi:hypothetical protein